jgi:hypothetical protein
MSQMMAPNESEISKVSLQMRAVLAVLTEDSDVYNLVSPFLNIVADSIDWQGLFALGLTASQHTLCQWAFCIWRDEAAGDANLFDLILNLDPQGRRAILRGLTIRWGLQR